jgi:hypothetical protein
MRENQMPIGKPNFIHKNFRPIENYFGFIECTVDIPKDILFPPLCIKRNGALVQPIGIITDVFYSEELKNSLQYGCKILKIHKICHFEKKAIIFKKFVDDFYFRRLSSTSEIEGYIFKLILNSLYGRFGIKKNFSKTKIIDEEDW